MIQDHITIAELTKRIPHRYPFLLVDRITEFKKDEYIVAVKNVTINEPFFTGHFPGNPVLPGVLMIEMAAQAALLFVRFSNPDIPDRDLYFLGYVKRFSIKKPVIPGDQISIRVEMVKQISTGAIVKTVLSVGTEQVARGELSFGRSSNGDYTD